jgi:hypothetical protein
MPRRTCAPTAMLGFKEGGVASSSAPLAFLSNGFTAPTPLRNP